MMQLDLFATAQPPDKERQRLRNYWFSQLRNWIWEAYAFRRSQYTTGWSCALSGHLFAIWLFNDGAITDTQYRRYMRLADRLKRIDTSRRNNNEAD